MSGLERDGTSGRDAKNFVGFLGPQNPVSGNVNPPVACPCHFLGLFQEQFALFQLLEGIEPFPVQEDHPRLSCDFAEKESVLISPGTVSITVLQPETAKGSPAEDDGASKGRQGKPAGTFFLSRRRHPGFSAVQADGN
jgi:hypothetical protein